MVWFNSIWFQGKETESNPLLVRSMERFEYENIIENIKQPYFKVNLKGTPMQSMMVEDILQMI